MYTASPILYYLGVCFKYVYTLSQYCAESNILLITCLTPHFHSILVVLMLVMSMVRDDYINANLLLSILCILCVHTIFFDMPII